MKEPTRAEKILSLLAELYADQCNVKIKYNIAKKKEKEEQEGEE